jgi:hypothetical protein
VGIRRSGRGSGGADRRGRAQGLWRTEGHRSLFLGDVRLHVTYTVRGGNVRLISARRASRREQRDYEHQRPDQDRADPRRPRVHRAARYQIVHLEARELSAHLRLTQGFQTKVVFSTYGRSKGALSFAAYSGAPVRSNAADAFS